MDHSNAIDQLHSDEHAHTPVRTYVMIGAILAAITAVEVVLYYLEAAEFVRPFLTPALLVLSALKFALVILYFMHLKFESKLYTGLFLFGLGVTGALLLAMVFLFLLSPAHTPANGALGISPAF